MDKEKLITLRVPQSVDDEISRISKLKDSDKSRLMRILLIKGMKDIKIEMAVDMYSKGRISLWKAARLADISLWEMIDIVKDKKIELQYGIRELKQDMGV